MPQYVRVIPQYPYSENVFPPVKIRSTGLPYLLCDGSEWAVRVLKKNLPV